MILVATVRHKAKSGSSHKVAKVLPVERKIYQVDCCKNQEKYN